MNDDVAKIAAEDGFQILDTGGGCKAFYRAMLDDSILLLTTDDGSDIPETLDDQCLLGHYTDEDLCEEATPVERGTAKECFQIAFRKAWSKAMGEQLSDLARSDS